MDVWVKLRLHSPSLAAVKTLSFVVTPVLRTCKVMMMMMMMTVRTKNKIKIFL